MDSFAFRFDRFLELLTSPQVVWGSVAGGFALLALALLVLALTRFGQSNPLRKCLILSVMTHVLLAAALSTVKVATATSAPGLTETRVQILSPQETSQLLDDAEQPPKPWERFATQQPDDPVPLDLERARSQEQIDLQRQSIADSVRLLGESSLANLPADETEMPVPGSIAAGVPDAEPQALKAPEPIEAAAAQRQQAPDIAVAAPQSPERASAGQSMEPRAAEPSPGGVSSELLNQTVSVPRLDEPDATPEPQSSLLDRIDSPTRGSQPAPQEDAPGLADVTRPSETDSSRMAATSGRQTEPSIDGVVRRPNVGQQDLDSLPQVEASISPPVLTANRRGAAEHEVPGIYRLRVAPDRARVARQLGGTQETEAAVNAALAWLTANQSGDGRWDASQFGSGREDKVLGHDRKGAGARADTGISGLALLAFLGAGHTHLDGPYQNTVARGLEFLMRSQGTNGNLGGEAELYAHMYCHGMALLALSEAYALTRDDRLENTVRRGVAYTLAAQHPTNGGWRYQPGDSQGDTSQLGWQLMALKSAKLAGLEIPRRAEEGMARFLKSVATGQHGGLASYRPNERASATMTAEALVCRHFLGLPEGAPAGTKEAGDLILAEPPGKGKPNLYYWYYATLAMHQLQGEYWDQWNAALRTALVDSQEIAGEHAGSWSPDTIWGGYGGRVYTTAMGALCLEVYYRFLPLYDQPAGN
jgi:hypothetical protein